MSRCYQLQWNLSITLGLLPTPSLPHADCPAGKAMDKESFSRAGSGLRPKLGAGLDKNSVDRNHQTCYHFESKISLVQKIVSALTLNLLEDVVKKFSRKAPIATPEDFPIPSQVLQVLQSQDIVREWPALFSRCEAESWGRFILV